MAAMWEHIPTTLTLALHVQYRASTEHLLSNLNILSKQIIVLMMCGDSEF